MNKLIILAFILFLSPQVYAQSCTDIATEIRNIDSGGFADYPLLNDVKQDVLLILYGRERETCPREVYDISDSTQKFIEDFDEAYRLANSDLSEDNLRAIELTRTLKDEANALSDFEGKFGVEGNDLITSAQQVVDDFLVLQADTYVREAGDTKVTSRKIEFYRVAALAYESSGNTLESTNNNVKAGVLEERYLEDMDKADALYSTAQEEYSKAISLKDGFVFSKISAYVKSRSSLIHLEDARVYYSLHHETETITAIENMMGDVRAAKQELREYLAVFFGAAAVVLTAFALFMVHRINTWNSDSYDYFLGNELVQVSQSEK